MTIYCPQCNSALSEVISTRKSANSISRRRSCSNDHRFTTIEVVVKNTGSGLQMPVIALELHRRTPVKTSHAPILQIQQVSKS